MEYLSESGISKVLGVSAVQSSLELSSEESGKKKLHKKDSTSASQAEQGSSSFSESSEVPDPVGIYIRQHDISTQARHQLNSTLAGIGSLVLHPPCAQDEAQACDACEDASPSFLIESGKARTQRHELAVTCCGSFCSSALHARACIFCALQVMCIFTLLMNWRLSSAGLSD